MSLLCDHKVFVIIISQEHRWESVYTKFSFCFAGAFQVRSRRLNENQTTIWDNTACGWYNPA